MKRLVWFALPLAFACSKAAAPQPSSGRIAIDITDQGFKPGDIAVSKGQPVTLVFARKTDQTCAKHVVIDVGGGQKIEKDLPLDTPVEVAVTFPTAGKLTYACSMDMIKGTITVQ